MKLSIIHVGDFHLNDKIDKRYIDLLLNGICLTNIEKVMLLITGDLASTGDKKEYDLFDELIKDLKLRIKNINPHIEFFYYFVPGNHDICFPKDKIDIARSSALYNRIDQNLIKSTYRSWMDNFYKYSKKNGLFLQKEECQRMSAKIGPYTIGINLINTAPYSLIGKDDKEKHRINLQEIKKLKNNDADFNFTLMHHSEEWFEEKSRSELIDLFSNYTSILFLGHVHETSFSTKNMTNGNQLCISTCGNFDLDQSTGFTNIIFDFNKRNAEFYQYQLDNSQNRFRVINKTVKNLNDLSTKKSFISKDVINEVSEVFFNSAKIPIDDLFVFPQLYFKSDRQIITNLKGLDEFSESHPAINIVSESQRGKTTLAKAIYKYFCSKTDCCFYEEGHKIAKNNFDRWLTKLISNQTKLNENDCMTHFNNVNKNDRVLIIDDFDKGEFDGSKFISFIKENFGRIIVLASPNEERFSIVFDESTTFSSVSIREFTLLQRNELVKKIVALRSNGSNDDDVNKIIKTIEIMNSQMAIQSLCNPTYLVLLINRLYDNDFYQTKAHDVYSETFKYSILKGLEKAFGEDKIDDYSAYIEALAFKLFQSKKSTFTEVEAREVYDSLREDYNIKIRFANAIPGLIRVGILKNFNNQYCFAQNAFLSYLIAKSILKTSNVEDITYLEEHIEEGLNSEILVFISSNYGANSFFGNIYNRLKELLSSENIATFDLDNTPILKALAGEKLPTKGEKKRDIEKRLDKQEEKVLEKTSIETNDAFSQNTDLNESEKKFLKVLKLADVLSKAVASFNSHIKFVERKKYLSLLQESSMYVLKVFTDFSDEEYDGFLKKIKELHKNDKGYDEHKLKIAIYDFTTTYALNFLTGFENSFVTKNAIDLFEYSKSDFNSLIFNAISLERYGNIEKFLEFISKNYRNSSNNGQYMLSRITWLFIVTKKISLTDLKKICEIENLSYKKAISLIDNSANILVEQLEKQKKK